MTQKQHVIHGRDHGPNGADPIPGIGTGGGAVEWEDTGTISPAVTANPTYDAFFPASLSTPFVKFTDPNIPSRTRYCPNWAQATIRKNTLAATFRNLEATNDVIVVTGGAWYRFASWWTFILPDTDTTSISEHFVNARTSPSVIFSQGGGIIPPSAASAKTAEWGSGGPSTDGYTRYWLTNAATLQMTGADGFSLNLRSIKGNLDALVNSAVMLYVDVHIEKVTL